MVLLLKLFPVVALIAQAVTILARKAAFKPHLESARYRHQNPVPMHYVGRLDPDQIEY